MKDNNFLLIKKTFLVVAALFILILPSNSQTKQYFFKYSNIKLSNNLLTLQFRIIDDKANVFGLNKNKQISVFLNGLQIKNPGLKIVSKNISAVILIDASGSINQTTRNAIKNETSSFLKTLREKDEVAVFTFNDFLVKNLGLTFDKKNAFNILNVFSASGRFSKIYDAIIETTLYLKKNAKYDSKAIVIISDGLDEGSRSNINEIIRLTKLYDVSVYSIGFSNINPQYFANLKQISSSTGGIFSVESSKKLSKKISSILKTTNILNFKVSNLKEENTIVLKIKNFNIEEKIILKLSKNDILLFNTSVAKQRKEKITLILFYIIIGLVFIFLWIFIYKKRGNLSYLEKLELFGFIKYKLLNNENSFSDIIRKLSLNKTVSKADINLLSQAAKKSAKLIDKENSILLSAVSKLQNQTIKKGKLPKQIIGQKNINILKKLFQDKKDHFSSQEKNLLSLIILETIKFRLSSGYEIPLTLSEYDFFLTIVEKRQFLKGELLSLITIIEEYTCNDDEKTLLLKITDDLKSFAESNKSNLGHLISDVYINEIKVQLKDFENKLKTLTNEEKKSLFDLALSNLHDDRESGQFYREIVLSLEISSSKLEELYRRLSLELMHSNKSEERKTVCCSALFKISMLATERSVSYKTSDFFGAENFQLFSAEYDKKHNKKINEKLFGELNSLRESFKRHNDNILIKLKTDFLDIKKDPDFDNAIDNILYKIYSAASQGYNFEDISKITSKYSADIIVKLLPFVIQIVKDSEGSQKLAGENILKNLALSLDIDNTDVAKIDNWEKWWKKNKTDIHKKVCNVEQSVTSESEGSLGFSKHEDLIFYLCQQENLREIKGHVIEASVSNLSVVFNEILPLETVIALYQREASSDKLYGSPYIFFKVMKIEVEDLNIYEFELKIIIDESKKYLKKLEKLIGN